MASIDDIVTVQKSGVEYLGRLIQTIQTSFAQVHTLTVGTFTCAASATTTVPQPLTAANSAIVLMPTNAAAATLMSGTNSLYVSARTANTSFQVSTAAAGAASGTETFTYILLTV